MTYREALDMCATMRKLAVDEKQPQQPQQPQPQQPQPATQQQQQSKQPSAASGIDWTWTDDDRSRTLWGGGYGALVGGLLGGLLGGGRGLATGLALGGLGGAAMGYGRGRLGEGLSWWGKPLWNARGQVYTGLPWDENRDVTTWQLPWYQAGNTTKSGS